MDIYNSMVLDSEPLRITCPTHGIGEMLTDLITSINYKLAALLFIAFIILTSDVFIKRILGHIKGATEGKNTTNYGAILQGILLVMFYIICDIINRGGFI